MFWLNYLTYLRYLTLPVNFVYLLYLRADMSSVRSWLERACYYPRLPFVFLEQHWGGGEVRTFVLGKRVEAPRTADLVDAALTPLPLADAKVSDKLIR